MILTSRFARGLGRRRKNTLSYLHTAEPAWVSFWDLRVNQSRRAAVKMGRLPTPLQEAITTYCQGFPGSSVIKNLPAKQETQVQFLGQEGVLEKEMATHFSYSCLGNLMDRGAWQAAVTKESDRTE